MAVDVGFSGAERQVILPPITGAIINVMRVYGIVIFIARVIDLSAYVYSWHYPLLHIGLQAPISFC